MFVPLHIVAKCGDTGLILATSSLLLATAGTPAPGFIKSLVDIVPNMRHANL